MQNSIYILGTYNNMHKSQCIDTWILTCVHNWLNHHPNSSEGMELKFNLLNINTFIFMISWGGNLEFKKKSLKLFSSGILAYVSDDFIYLFFKSVTF